MRTRVFLKIMIGFSLGLLSLGVVSLVGSQLVFFFSPPTQGWNDRQLKKIVAADAEPRSFSFAVFGDNKNSITTFNRLIAKINHDEVSFAVELGDLIDNRIDGKAEYKTYLGQARRFKQPLLVIPGNHETEGSSRDYNRLFGRSYYAFTFGDAYFIALDGSHKEGLAPQQSAWLKKELKKSQAYRYRFVFMHIPLYDPRAGDDQAGHSMTNKAAAENLNALFDANRVTMVFTAHIHGYYTGKWQATPYTISGGAGAGLYGTDEAHFFNHYLKVSVSNDGIDYDVKKIGPSRSNILTQSAHKLTEFAHSHFISHWDYLLVLLGGLGSLLGGIGLVAGRFNRKAEK